VHEIDIRKNGGDLIFSCANQVKKSFMVFLDRDTVIFKIIDKIRLHFVATGIDTRTDIEGVGGYLTNLFLKQDAAYKPPPAGM